MAELEGVYVSGVPHYGPKGMRAWIIVVVTWMMTLACVSIILRVLSRRVRKQKLWWDDYLVMFSMVWNWAVVGIGFAMYIEGVGYHAKDLSTKAIENISMWLLITEVIYIWNLCWTKISLLMLYYRIFRFPFFKKQVVAVGAFVVAWAITITFLFTFICVPVQKLWKPDLPGRCVSELGVWLANASSTMLSDIAILLLPIPQVWTLRLKKAEKIGVTFAFGLGFFAVFASSYRTWVLFNYSKNDISYTLAPLLVWSQIEMSAGIISACLPTMRPVVRAAAQKMGCCVSLRSERGTKTTGASQLSSGGLSNRSEGTSAKPPRLSLHMKSALNRQSYGNPFYTLQDDSDLEGAGADGSESDKRNQWRAESKTSRYATSSVDGYAGREETTMTEIPMQRLWHKNEPR